MNRNVSAIVNNHSAFFVSLLLKIKNIIIKIQLETQLNVNSLYPLYLYI